MNSILKDKFKKRMFELGRLFTKDEAFEFYTENVMRTKGGCKISPYGKYLKDRQAWQEAPIELTLCELECRANDWHRRTIGSLVVSGDINIDFTYGR